MVKEELVTLSLPYRNGEKTVRVFVPEHEQDETLPVIYFADGQNLFEDDNVRFGCWYTREAVRAEYEKQFAEAGIQIVYFPYTKGVSSTKINEALDAVRKHDLSDVK